MSNIVKIKQRSVYLNNVVVGDIKFDRFRYKDIIEPVGYFRFTVDGQEYQLNTSGFAYSKDANKYIRKNLEEFGIDALRNFTKLVNIRLI